ncbi:hypothetical protein [Nonomuraea sp. B1E8]
MHHGPGIAARRERRSQGGQQLGHAQLIDLRDLPWSVWMSSLDDLWEPT